MRLVTPKRLGTAMFMSCQPVSAAGSLKSCPWSLETRSVPAGAERAPILDGLGQMRRADAFAFGQIGDRARHAKDAVIGARGQAESIQRAFEQAAIGSSKFAIALRFAVAQCGIWFAGALLLALTRGDDPGTHRRTGFAGSASRAEFAQRHARYFDLQVDAIEQGPGHARAIASHRFRWAAAAARDIAGVAARTRIHRRYELECGGEFGLARRTRNHNAPGFQRFTQHFEHAPIELGQFVQEQYT